MIRRLLPLLAALAFGIAGCSNDTGPFIGGKIRTKEIKTIVSLSPSTTEIVNIANRIQDLKGRTAACNYPPAYIKNIPVVAGVKPDYETLAMLKPDLIVYDRDLYTDADIAKIKQSGAQTFELNARTMDDYFKQMAQLGTLLGTETYVSAYTDRLYRWMQSAQGSAPSVRPKVALVMAGTGSEHLVAGTDSFQAAEIQASGGTPVGPKAPNFVPMNPEAFIQMDPDFIVFAGKSDTFVKDPRFAGLKAIKNGRYANMLEDVAVRRGGRVDKFVDALSKVIQGHTNG